MGVFGRVAEGCGCFSAPTSPTNNARNEAMMQAVNVFGAQVKKCEAAIRSAHASNLELLTSTQGAMAVPLPQAYQGVAKGTAATPTSVALDLVGGTGADVHGVSRAANEAGHKLETEVLAPLSRWQEVHRQLQAHHKELRATQREVDKRRRAMARASTKVMTMRGNVGAGGGAAAEHKLDTRIQKMSHKEAELQVATQRFDQQEAQLAQDLTALIADARFLKHFIAAALRLESGALQSAADAWGDLASADAPPSPSAADTPASSGVSSPVGSPMAVPLTSGTGTAVLEAGDAGVLVGGLGAASTNADTL